MPRPRRYAPPDSILHVVNRGNDRKLLFGTRREYEDFLRLVARTKERAPMRLLAYCLMPNHWHLVLWPESARAVSAFCHRLCTIHSIRHRRKTNTIGHGHLYQGRYHSVVVESARQYYQVMRYVEANALRAGLVDRAQAWRWSSLADRTGADRGLLDAGPLPLPPGWADLVNQSLPQEVLEETRDLLRGTRRRNRRLLTSGAQNLHQNGWVGA